MIGLAAGLTGARAGTPRRLSPTSPKMTSPTPTGSATRRASRPCERPPGRERRARVAGFYCCERRGRAPLGFGPVGEPTWVAQLPRRSRRGSRDGSPARCGLLAWCRANRGRGNNPTRPGTTCVPLDRRTAVLGAGSARGRERARFIGAERARRPGGAGRPCCDRGLGRSRRSRGAAVGSACEARSGSRLSGSR